MKQTGLLQPAPSHALTADILQLREGPGHFTLQAAYFFPLCTKFLCPQPLLLTPHPLTQQGCSSPTQGSRTLGPQSAIRSPPSCCLSLKRVTARALSNTSSLQCTCSPFLSPHVVQGLPQLLLADCGLDQPPPALLTTGQAHGRPRARLGNFCPW